jgi:hypothetical protein
VKRNFEPSSPSGLTSLRATARAMAPTVGEKGNGSLPRAHKLREALAFRVSPTRTDAESLAFVLNRQQVDALRRYLLFQIPRLKRSP